MRGAKYTGGIKILRFQPITRYILQTIRNSATVTMRGEQETTPKLSNSTSLNDLE